MCAIVVDHPFLDSLKSIGETSFDHVEVNQRANDCTNVAGPRGATGAGDISAVIGPLVYLDVIERRFTDALQAVEKRVVNDDRAHLQQLAGRVAIRVLAGEPEAATSMGEEALPLLEARVRERPDDTFAIT